MSDTKSLLNRISAFRERLERTPALLQGDLSGDPTAAMSLAVKQALQPAWVSSTLRQIVSAPASDTALPTQLIGRARRLLEQARELVTVQRRIGEDLFFLRLESSTDGQVDPLVSYQRATVAATDATLRLAQAMPSSAEHQSKICDGLETLLQSIRDRLGLTTSSLDRRRTDWGRIERIARLLCDLQARRLVSFSSFAELAEELLDEARRGLPMRWLTAPGEPVARTVAAHALNVAQVLARIAPNDFEWASQAFVPVSLGLIMDVGMLAVSATTLEKEGVLDPAEWNGIERHPATGAALLSELMPELGPLAEAVAMHHERLDGTGYPASRKGDDVSTLARMLALADAYAAMMCDRPYRPALDPRTAMTDLLMMAEQGRLDRELAESFLKLSFHPVGTVVELTDGRVAVVVSTHTGRINLRATTRPVVAVLTDVQGSMLPKPEFIDLAGSEYGGVVRALGTAEKRRILAAQHPDLCF